MVSYQETGLFSKVISQPTQIKDKTSIWENAHPANLGRKRRLAAPHPHLQSRVLHAPRDREVHSKGPLLPSLDLSAPQHDLQVLTFGREKDPFSCSCWVLWRKKGRGSFQVFPQYPPDLSVTLEQGLKLWSSLQIRVQSKKQWQLMEQWPCEGLNAAVLLPILEAEGLNISSGDETKHVSSRHR